MDNLKKGYREGEKKVREVGRDIDGHDVGDDVGNLGDEIKTRVGNAGDDIRTGVRNAEDEVERHDRPR
jgi:hypothetical protein